MGEGEDGLVVREARGAPGDRGGGLRRDVGDEPWEEVDGAVDGAHGRPRQPARQQRSRSLALNGAHPAPAAAAVGSARRTTGRRRREIRLLCTTGRRGGGGAIGARHAGARARALVVELEPVTPRGGWLVDA